MGKITSLSEFKNKKPKLKLETKTLDQAFEEASKGLYSLWMFRETQDSLNEFISERLQEDKDWFADRTLVAKVETDIGLEFMLMSPGYTFDNLLGWKASFVWSGDKTFETPVVSTEIRARLYCILLYLTFIDAASDIQSHGL